ncbi:hypothetical protein ACFLST_01645, partial [Chloroflexota bacterium]
HGAWVLIGHFAADDGTSDWVINEFPLPDDESLDLARGRPVEVQLCATGAPWAQFNIHGQVQVDWIELIGDGGEVK